MTVKNSLKSDAVIFRVEVSKIKKKPEVLSFVGFLWWSGALALRTSWLSGSMGTEHIVYTKVVILFDFSSWIINFFTYYSAEIAQFLCFWLLHFASSCSIKPRASLTRLTEPD